MHFAVYFSPECPHCVKFLKELKDPAFQQQLRVESGDAISSPIEYIDVLSRPEKRKSVPTFKTVPHVVLLDDWGDFVAAFPKDRRTARNLGSFARKNATGKKSRGRSRRRRGA